METKRTSLWISIGIVLAALLFMGQSCQTEEDIAREKWEQSAHADETADAFTHWDDEDPPEIPTECAKCHSTTGMEDFLGADGSTSGQVDSAVQTGEVVNCHACHNDATQSLTSVTFPSGQTVTGLGAEAICLECHQGRTSASDVNAAITDAGIKDEDAAVEDLEFVNIHYHVAAATLYGSDVSGGYEYSGTTYAGKNSHTTGYATCVECHDRHSLEVATAECFTCHASAENIKDIRYATSTEDYDGDGDTAEGIYYEIAGLQEKLYSAMQSYAVSAAGTGIVYDVDTYPYFFADTNENDEADADELSYGNRYTAWTARLLKAAYNYHMSRKDPGGYVHNPRYVIELLQTSAADLEAMTGG